MSLFCISSALLNPDSPPVCNPPHPQALKWALSTHSALLLSPQRTHTHTRTHTHAHAHTRTHTHTHTHTHIHTQTHTHKHTHTHTHTFYLSFNFFKILSPSTTSFLSILS